MSLETMGYEGPQSRLQSFRDDYLEGQFYGEQEVECYDDSEWSTYEQYEEVGEEFWPPSYDESQSWQFDDFAWQFGGEQSQPQRLSVRERLGTKKPALLGTAPR